MTEMRSLARRAMAADPEDSRGHMLAGMAEMWLRRPARAKTLLRQAIALNPSLALAHAELGSCLNLDGEPSLAIESLRTALRLSPYDIHLFYPLGELAVSYSMLGRWTEAIDHAEQALDRRPAYWYAHTIKINALVRSGEIDAAVAALAELRAAKPNFSQDYFDWVPFVSHSWTDHFIEGLTLASEAAGTSGPSRASATSRPLNKLTFNGLKATLCSP